MVKTCFAHTCSTKRRTTEFFCSGLSKMDQKDENDEKYEYEMTESSSSSSGEDLASKYTKDYKLHVMSRTTERIVNIPAPYSHTLSDEEFFTEDVFPNIPVIIDHLFHEGKTFRALFSLVNI